MIVCLLYMFAFLLCLFVYVIKFAKVPLCNKSKSSFQIKTKWFEVGAHGRVFHPARSTSTNQRIQANLPSFKVCAKLALFIFISFKTYFFFGTQRNFFSIINSSKLEKPLTFSNYKEKFSDLIQVEELQMEKDIRSYDMEGVTFTKDPSDAGLLTLVVTQYIYVVAHTQVYTVLSSSHNASVARNIKNPTSQDGREYNFKS